MSKITARHLERKACVYVRQSSLQQVAHHRESTQRQYRLRDQAVRLGWRADDVEVIDEDQGQSGASAGRRSGFQRLISEVALGQVGAIVGLVECRATNSKGRYGSMFATRKAPVGSDEKDSRLPSKSNNGSLAGAFDTVNEPVAVLHGHFDSCDGPPQGAQLANSARRRVRFPRP